jgi:choline dehydrogenase-like flavoprotein
VLVLKKDRDITPAEVAGRADRYLASFRAHGKWKVRIALVALAYWPILKGRPPFHMMSPTLRQRWVQHRFLDDVADRRLPAPILTLRQSLIRAAQQFCFLGYYSDPRAAAKAGYIPFSQRDEFADAMKKVAPGRRKVTCLDPAEIPGEELTADVIVVGTGAAGAMLAYGLAARGRQVLMLERGAHVDPDDFTEDEATQLSNLYSDGALTLSKDFRFQVAQGMCVGGSTVVNNAVCFDLPEHVLERWNGSEFNAGLDPVRLRKAFLDVRDFLRIGPAGPPGALNPGAVEILRGLGEESPFKVVDSNMTECLGCGYCNIGCKYGKKLSMLDETLPRAQAEFGDRVRILADCRVDKVLMRGAQAVGVRAKLTDGRKLTVRAGTVVLSAGALASSAVLQRSGLGQGRAGQGLAFNIASPLTLDFERVLHSERGMQITHYVEPGDDGAGTGTALETWFNPIVSQSLFMPGWFEDHWDNMRRYAHMTCLGVVVGTESNGSVKAARGGGVKLDYTPSDRDMIRIKEGMRLAAELGLRAGAERVMPATFRPIEIRTENQLYRIDEEIGNNADLSINSAHPQGGNPISIDPTKGVVDPSFMVYGTTNLYVCDASVFPSSITVNPQLTVMALATYAAEEIGGPLAAGAQRGDASTSQVLAPGPGS